MSMQAAPISLRSAKAAINQGLETDLLGGMKIEEQQYAKVSSTLHTYQICVLGFHCCAMPSRILHAAVCIFEGGDSMLGLFRAPHRQYIWFIRDLMEA